MNYVLITSFNLITSRGISFNLIPFRGYIILIYPICDLFWTIITFNHFVSYHFYICLLIIQFLILFGILLIILCVINVMNYVLI